MPQQRTLFQRMTKLKTRLLSIRLGSGAIIFPPEVKKLNMRFHEKGPWKFWHNELIRLKYHNPTVQMNVDRTAAAEDSATMSVHFAAGSRESSTASPTSSSPSGSSRRATEHVQSIEMKDRTSSEILRELVLITRARPYNPTDEDIEMEKSLEEDRIKAARAREFFQESQLRLKRNSTRLIEEVTVETTSQTA